MPITLPDTTNNVHLAAISSSEYATMLTSTPRIEAVWNWNNGSPSAYPTVWKGIYVPADRQPDINFYANTQSLSWFLTNHPDWIMYKADQSTIAYAFGQTTDIPLDVSNPACFAWLTTNIWGPLLAGGQYQHLDVDNFQMTNGGSWSGQRVGHWTGAQGTSTWVPLYNGTNSDPAYRAYMIQLASDIKSWLTAHYSTTAFCANFSYDNNFPTDSDSLMGHADVLMDEQGYTNGNNAPPWQYLDTVWVNKSTHMASFLSSASHGWIDVNQSAHAFSSLTYAEKLWAIGNHLLLKNSASWVWTGGSQEYNHNDVMPEYAAAAVGSASGAYYADQSVYRRDFSNGVAFVNPSSTVTHSVTLPAGLHTGLDGAVLASTVSMGPGTALVGVSAGSGGGTGVSGSGGGSASGILIESNVNLTDNNSPQSLNDFRHTFVASNGQRIVTTSGPPDLTQHYSTSPDGVAWSTPAALEPPPYRGGAAQSMVGDILNSLFFDVVGTSTSSTITIQTQPYSTSTDTFGAATTHSWATPTGLAMAGAAWDSVNNVWHVVFGKAFDTRITALSSTAAPGATGAVYATGNSLIASGVRIIPGTTTTGFILLNNQGGAVIVIPFTYTSSGGYAIGAAETVATGPNLSIAFTACELDVSGKLDVLWTDGSFGLNTRKRNGAGSYSPLTPLASGVNSADGGFSLTPTPAGDLYCVYSSTANRSAGELYLVRRAAGTWQNPRLLVGGDEAAYGRAKTLAMMTATNRIDVAYRTSTISPFSVYYTALSNGSQPDTPVPIAPSGNETSLTPTASYTYTNVRAPIDGQLSAEYQFKLGATIVFDSGEITTAGTSNVYGANGNTSDPNYVTAAALNFGDTVTWSVRVKDVMLGLWSGWSTPTSFTPVQGGTVTIASVIDNAITLTSSPATIQAPTIDGIEASWSHPQTHDANAYRDTLYNSAQTATIAQTAITTIAGSLASGSSFTSGSWAIAGLTNSTTYHLVRSYRDGVTGLFSDSAAWTLTTAWVPPPPVTGFTVAVTYPAGTANGTWTNPGAAATDLVERSVDGGTTWVAIKSGSLFTTFSDPAPLGVPLLYRVTDISALGIASTPVVASPVTVGANGMFGVCLTDSRFPDVFVWLGVLDQGDWKNASQFTGPDDIYSQTPFGQEIPFSSKRLQAFGLAQSRAYTVPMVGQYADGTPTDGPTQIATLKAMAKVYNACLYRDVLGRAFYVVIENVQDGYSGSGHPLLRVQFDLRQTPGPISLVI